MYTIKGHDGKEYGPVDAAQVQLWLSQGRADTNTLIRGEGSTDWRPIGSFPELVVSAPPPPIRPISPPPPGSPISTLIPYRNVPALISYYLGVFSLIPCIGILLGLAAIVLGVIGLNRASKHPETKGKAHAWVGIILGALVLIGHIIFCVLLFAAAARNQHQNGTGWHV